MYSSKPLILLVPGTRIELVRDIISRDFKSLASTNSATQAKPSTYRINSQIYAHWFVRQLLTGIP